MIDTQNPDERRLTAAQADHLRGLYAAFEQAEGQLNDFAAYLLREHGIEDPHRWQLSADLTRFVRVPEPPPPPAEGTLGAP